MRDARLTPRHIAAVIALLGGPLSAILGCGDPAVGNPLAPPSFSPGSGSYNSAQVVTITANPSATIYYTMDGKAPTISSTVYTQPIKISRSTTLETMAVIPDLGFSSVATAAYTISSASGSGMLPFDIVCWGDSMTAGQAGVTDIGQYPAILLASTTGKVANEGIGGQTSTQIGVRQGGIPTYATVAGSEIPAYGAGGTIVSFPRGYEPLTSDTGAAYGYIADILGKVTLSAPLPGGTFTFTRLSPGGSPVSAPGQQLYTPRDLFKGYTAILWEGRNNLFPTPNGPWGVSQILSDIAAEVAALPPEMDYLVLSVANEETPAELRGQSNYSTIIDLDNQLAAIYGVHYLDIRSVLVKAYNPSLPTDISDFNNDVVPTSLRSIEGTGILADKIGPDDQSFTVNLAPGALKPGYVLTIDDENIYLESVSGSTVTASIRGFGGTVADHVAGSTVTETSPVHLNKDGDTVVANAVAQKLSQLAGIAYLNRRLE